MPRANPSGSSARTAERPTAGRPRSSATLVVGLGNPLRGDDGVGLAVVEALRAAPAGSLGDVELDELSVGGLALMERLIGYDRVVIVDAVSTNLAEPGAVRCLDLDEIEWRSSAHLDSSHDASLLAALEAAQALGVALPGDIRVVTIEAAYIDRFAEGLSAPVAAAVPRAVKQVLHELRARGRAA